MPEITLGTRLILSIEKAVAGGRMLARHDGQVVLVTGGIPGERVEAVVRRVVSRTPQAEVTAVLDASADRRAVEGDQACAGQVYAHVAYPRQLRLKVEILEDAWARVARLPWPEVALETVASPEHGYRMRARLHGKGRRIGFLRDGTHEICAASAGGQLLPATVAWVGALETRLAAAGLDASGVEMTESVDGVRRACHVTLQAPPPAGWAAPLEADGATAVSWSVERRGRDGHAGRGRRSAPRRAEAPIEPGASLVDDVHPVEDGPGLPLRRHARAFFQGNRYLLDRLARHVARAAASAPVLDLYAGVGLFGLSAAAAGAPAVVAVEGDAVSGGDLIANARPFGASVQAVRQSVEDYLRGRAADRLAPGTVILDPPRTGLGPDLAARVAGLRAGRVVFVSCDPATFARDARVLTDAGYALTGLTLFDLFPNTAHVECVAIFDR